MSLTLLIARHGNTFAAGELVRRVGITDIPLVESGLQQGYLLGKYLSDNTLIPDIIFTSTLQRTIQTATEAQRAMHTDLPMQPLALFNEIDYGPDENQPEEHVIARIGHSALTDWDINGQVPEGWQVNPAEIIQNWYTFANMLIKEYSEKTILVITSNGIARFAPYLTGNFAFFCAQHSIKLATGALSIFTPSPTSSHWTCTEWNIKPKSEPLCAG